MRTGSATNILWMAHVLPLYAIRFRLSPQEALQLLESLNLADWVTGSKNAKTMREIVKAINPRLFKPWVLQGGTVAMNAYDIPEIV